ncbi:rod shape-determining protein MreC [Chitinimonas lacunae]|uniref:Cell shape-determining protein MreC n=1 Tax=Chitinimonas lacunae TaxID=1963018 RepID=A0ABV8MSY0_9NEIS
MQATIQPAFFKQGPKPLHRFLLYAALSLALTVIDTRWHLLAGAREVASVALYPLQRLATAPVAMAQHVGDFLTAQSTLLRENRRLQDERLLANAQLMRMQDLQMENAQLKRLMSALESRRGGGVLTEVLYHARDPFTAKLIVDRGVRAGVREGLPVIDPLGLVGQITRVQPLTAEITLITEKSQAVPVQVQRTGQRAVVFGGGREHPLEVRFMPLNADIRPDDVLVTSGIDGAYPAGLPVARVRQVDRNAGRPFAGILCEPIAEVDRHRYFLILDETRRLPEKPPVPAEGEAKKKPRRRQAAEEE